MIVRVLFLPALLVLLNLISVSEVVRADDAPLSRIAFGSCAKQENPQPIWNGIQVSNPQLFLFIGDNIYGDTRDMAALKAKWAKLGAQSGYQKLKSSVPILATWDDHDYGENDAGSEYPKKVESQRIFLDFFEEPADSPRRKREGVYLAKMFGPEDKRVQVLLLDTRYFRSPLIPKRWQTEPGSGEHGVYLPNTNADATMLGETQWKWLEAELKKPAKVRIIASSIQVVADQHGWEKWGLMPHERQRLFDLIRKTKANGVIFVSGDRHHAEISRLPAEVVGYPIYDVTSSSLNQPSKWRNELNEHRVGVVYNPENFGTIHIDWQTADPTIRLQVRGMQNDVVLQAKTSLSELQPPAD
ncbi:alkaline phosphatase D family protein [Thalassoroseus pseudoceratinae]|uniref:alkaline phosphatase D family protein n=1 Tax=Thalassoroseus pseudoceratinae TaxID=2713176 RepID=UPI0014237CAB|nr:alkaline phosphatase D family protein [Thalassoroseus pseudoceratinae]